MKKILFITVLLLMQSCNLMGVHLNPFFDLPIIPFI